jgi:hypothetical protein
MVLRSPLDDLFVPPFDLLSGFVVVTTVLSSCVVGGVVGVVGGVVFSDDSESAMLSWKLGAALEDMNSSKDTPVFAVSRVNSARCVPHSLPHPLPFFFRMHRLPFFRMIMHRVSSVSTIFFFFRTAFVGLGAVGSDGGGDSGGGDSGGGDSGGGDSDCDGAWTSSTTSFEIYRINSFVISYPGSPLSNFWRFTTIQLFTRNHSIIFAGDICTRCGGVDM